MGALAINGGTPVRTRPFPAWPTYDEREEQALRDVLHSRLWTSSPGYFGDRLEESSQARRLEREFAAYHGVKHAVAVGSGTDALQIGYKTAGVGLGDEVIVTPLTFVATVTPILQLGAIPIFVDVDPETRLVDPAAVEAAITERTALIVPVHVAGYPCDMDRLGEISRKHGIPIVADAAHAHGSAWRGKMLPCWSEMAAFSLQQDKQVTPGEGGMLLTDDDRLAEYAYIYHDDGRGRGAEHGVYQLAGWNYRMSEFQAAVARVQLARLDEVIERKTHNFDRLAEALAQHGDGIRRPRRDPRMTRLSYLYPSLRYDAALMKGVPAETFAAALRAEGIPCGGGSLARPLYRHPVFAEKRYFTPGRARRMRHPAEEVDYTKVSCPVAEDATRGIGFSQRLLLGDDADTRDLVDAFEKVLEHLGELARVGAPG